MENYIGKKCFQCHGFKTVIFGHIIDQKLDGKWLTVLVSWEHSSEQTWEKAQNVGFTDPQRKYV